MTDQEIFEKMTAIIKPFAKDEEALSALSMSSLLLEDLKIDSVRLVDVILEMETQFSIEIDNDDIEKIQKMSDAVAVVKTKK